MTTWSCKAPAAALALSALAACLDGQGTTALLGGTTASAPAPASALTKISLKAAPLTLAAPPGYCFDPQSIRARFALLARCDTLGMAAGSRGAPLAVITLSLPARIAATPSLPSPDQIAAAKGLDQIGAVQQLDQGVIFVASGPAPQRDLSTRHWHGSALIRGEVIGLALYGPEGGAATGAEGGAILRALIQATERANAD